MEESLQALYAAAKADDWNLCLEHLETLLPLIPQSERLRIVLIYVQEFIDIANNYLSLGFEGRELDYTQPETTLQHLRVLYDMLTAHTNSGGVGNFRNRVKLLITLLETETLWDEAENTQLVKVFAGVLAGLLAVEWGHENKDLWRQWYEQESKSAFFILAEHFWPDPKTRARAYELWHSVAKNIEDVLSSKL